MESPWTPYRNRRSALLWGWGLTQKEQETQFFRSRMSMRFHPKRRASTDQAPGPSMARAAPRVPKRIKLQGSRGCVKALQVSMIARSTPAMGVHKPASRSIPAAIARTCITAMLVGGALCSSIILRTSNAMPTTRRMSRRPAPGQPRANVEKSRRKTGRA